MATSPSSPAPSQRTGRQHTHGSSPQHPRPARPAPRQKAGTARPERSTPRRKRRSAGWIPNQHGAWFMVTVPAITGFVLAPSWTGLAVLLTWWLGYFSFFAASVWMRSRFHKRHLQPVVVYSGLTALAAVVTLALDWTLLRWVPLYVPLVAIAVWETYRRRPRSLASGVATVIAAGLILPVVVSAAWAPHTFQLGEAFVADARTWAITCVYLAFFIGTVPYVKTLIRERGNRTWLLGSIIYHVVFVIGAITATAAIADAAILSWAVPAVAVALLARAILMPLLGARRERPWTPKTVGLLDSLLTLVVILAAW